MPPLCRVSQKKTVFPPKLSTIKSRHEGKHILKPSRTEDHKKFSPKQPCTVSSRASNLWVKQEYRVRGHRSKTIYTGSIVVLLSTLGQTQNLTVVHCKCYRKRCKIKSVTHTSPAAKTSAAHQKVIIWGGLWRSYISNKQKIHYVEQQPLREQHVALLH